ncbi:porin [Fibrella sp. HMF5335]|uniref:Porin n=1 Tax=Fibrella rubiginis TaxID=2817060 RepID=A0A939GCN5_9BACT|nr:porin [Fibrella rubiginis]MBO0935105.1 porin [Fibrella rubiginis]
MKTFFSALAMASVSYTSIAQTTDTTTASAPTQAATQAVPNSGLTVSGYVEAYYSHDFSLAKTTQERPSFLYNHRRNREVNVNLAFIKAAYVNDRVRGNLALQVGTYPQYNYAAEQALIKNLFEANAGVKLSKNRDLWLDAGIFASHIGFESAISKDCWTLTRSILAENSPYYLSGAKMTYNTANGKWTLLGSVVNGWQRIKRLDGYSGPSLSTQVQYRPSPELTLNWSSFLGSDRPDSLRQTRFFNNFYAIINPQGRFGVILGFDIGSDQKPVVRTGSDARVEGGGSYVWYSPVVIARYKTSDKSYVNGRVEYYDDKAGTLIGTPGFQTMGYSLGYDYAMLPNALFRLEGKMYDSKTPLTTFENRRVNTSLTTSIAISF